MDKREFLDTLRSQLSGHLPDQKIQSHLIYYQDYIDTQIRNGSNEQEVLEKLGSPLLIAKTLLDTDEGESYYMEHEDSYETPSEEKTSYKHKSYKLDLTTWYGKAIVIIVAILVIIGLFVIIGTLLPIAAVIALILFIYSKFRKS